MSSVVLVLGLRCRLLILPVVIKDNFKRSFTYIVKVYIFRQVPEFDVRERLDDINLQLHKCGIVNQPLLI